jgi:sec-independent protein translocase protein TatB
MLDVGWQELLVIAAVAIIFIGPKELPRVLRTVMGIMRKARMVASEFHDAINEAARQADLDDVKKQVEAAKITPQELIERGIDPGGDIKKELTSVGSDVQAAATVPKPPIIEAEPPVEPPPSLGEPMPPPNKPRNPDNG